MLKEGYTLIFRSRPSLTRSPKLSTAMYILIRTYIGWRHYISLWTRCSRAKISGFLQPFLVSKPHNHWRPILGLSKPNLSETMRATLQQWEWVTLKDYKDAYFHVTIQKQSRTCQILWLGWDIPVQSTVFQPVHCTHGYAQGYRNHQYLDDWLVKATSHQVCLQHTQDLVKICQELGWLVNLENRNCSQAGL